MASYKAGNVHIDLSANSAELSTGLSKAERDTQKAMRAMQKEAKRAQQAIEKSTAKMASSFTKAGGLTAAVFAGVEAFSQFGISVAQAQVPIDNLATKMGITSEEVLGFESVLNGTGVSLEQYADIVKDVDDKLGDFAATGGGEMKNFFENVAPLIGLTSEELMHLSGDEVLRAVQKAMDDANISAKEQVFYLEAISNDSSKLQGVLRKTAKEIETETKRWSDLAVVLDENVIEQMKENKSQHDIFANNASVFITTSLAPLIDKWNDLKESAAGYLQVLTEFEQKAQKQQQILNETNDFFKNSLVTEKEKIKSLEDQISAMQGYSVQGRGFVDTSKENEEAIQELQVELDKATESYDNLLQARNNYANAGQLPLGVDPVDVPKPTTELKPIETGTDSTGTETDTPTEFDKSIFDQDSVSASLIEYSNSLSEKANIYEMFGINELQAIQMHEDSKMAMIDAYAIEGLLSYEEAEKAKEALTKARVDSEMAMEKQKYSDAVNLIGKLTGHEEAAAKISMALNKSEAIQEVIANTEVAVTKAMGLPFPENIPAMALAVAQGASSLTKVTGLSGQFHDGGMIPQDGTYYMQGGEMVIPKDKVPDMSNGGMGEIINVSAPVNVQGNVTDEKWFQAQLIKQRDAVGLAVSKVRQERGYL
ncbi:hypothetical protein ACED51_14290 [Photobacterium swingsii]|uniref:hypothetical protein n=1 Tax=Photobacterium swingsii TaxID=680026 RepID=UPI00352C4456